MRDSGRIYKGHLTMLAHIAPPGTAARLGLILATVKGDPIATQSSPHGPRLRRGDPSLRSG